MIAQGYYETQMSTPNQWNLLMTILLLHESEFSFWIIQVLGAYCWEWRSTSNGKPTAEIQYATNTKIQETWEEAPRVLYSFSQDGLQKEVMKW